MMLIGKQLGGKATLKCIDKSWTISSTVNLMSHSNWVVDESDSDTYTSYANALIRINSVNNRMGAVGVSPVPRAIRVRDQKNATCLN